jgi:putative SOS response-associated peptidase YedK
LDSVRRYFHKLGLGSLPGLPRLLNSPSDEKHHLFRGERLQHTAAGQGNIPPTAKFFELESWLDFSKPCWNDLSQMCGRYNKLLTEFVENYHDHLRDFMDVMKPGEGNQYNIAPSTIQSIRCANHHQAFIQSAKWGFTPFWSKDGSGYQINARCETAAKKPMFKQAFEMRRCVTWATGYYEWQTIGSIKQPYHIHFVDHRPFFLYGIWQKYKNAEGKSIPTFALMTTTPAEHLRRIHDRMPCIASVDSSDVEYWLDHNDDDFESRHKLLRPFESERLVAEPVNTYVNSVKNQGSKCIERVSIENQL